MLGGLFSHEKHIQMVSDVYKDNAVNEEKLSKLMTYLKSKTSNIPSALDYLKIKAREEVYSSHQLRVTSRILRSIIEQLRSVSICYESRTIKIFIGIIKEVLRLKKIGKFEYSDHQEFLDVFTYFFSTVPIRAHKSERYIRRILFVATGVTRTIMDPDRNRLDLLSDDNGAECYRGFVAAEVTGSDDETSSLVDFQGCEVRDLNEISDARFDYLFLEIIHTLMGVEDILRTDYDEKYGWLVNSLIRPGEVNSLKRREIFRLVVQKANVISGHSLIYYVLKYSSCMKKSNMDILLEQLQPNLYPQIVLQTNMNILEIGRGLSRETCEDGSSRDDTGLEECKLLVRDVMDILGKYEISHLNQKEIALSFFNILKTFFSEKPGCEDAFDFVLAYVREYFERCRFVSDVFYGFLRRILQGFPDRYTERLKTTIFEEVQRYFIIHSAHISDPKFIVLLLNSSTKEFGTFCCKILYIAKDYFITRTLKPSVREGIMGKLRSLFYKTGNKDLFHLLVELMRHDIPLKDQYKIVCLLKDMGLLGDKLVHELSQGKYVDVGGFISGKLNRTSIEPYNVDDDEKIYGMYLNSINRGMGRHRCPETGTKSRRHSRIMLVDYDH